VISPFTVTSRNGFIAAIYPILKGPGLKYESRETSWISTSRLSGRVEDVYVY
jgi:hypothetical protein